MDLRPEPDVLTYVSICTGGGGLDLGVELAIPSARAVCMVEREAFACAHLVEAMCQGLMAPAPVWSDARTFRGRAWRGGLDGLIGGIPCQPHSVAGRRLGQADERDLWSPARRIIVQSGAWWVLIENVPGMLSAGEDETAGAERVWRDLQRLGFEVEGGLFEAPEVGATDERQRLFILAVADAGRGFVRGQRRPGQERGAARAPEGDRRERQWLRGSAGGCGADLSSGVGLADPSRDRRGAGRLSTTPNDGGRWGAGSSEGDQSSPRGGELADSGRAGLPLAQQPGQPGQKERRVKPWSTASELRGAHVVDASGGGRDGRPEEPIPDEIRRVAVERPSGVPLWPPRPDDAEAWRDILDLWPAAQPAVRGMAHGLAGRVDPLRMLGNGVKPLQAAYALRTLATRLAASGSAGAAELVRRMTE